MASVEQAGEGRYAVAERDAVAMRMVFEHWIVNDFISALGIGGEKPVGIHVKLIVNYDIRRGAWGLHVTGTRVTLHPTANGLYWPHLLKKSPKVGEICVGLRWIAQAQHKAAGAADMLPPVNGFVQIG